MKRAKYTEPTDFIPEDIRKELKLGEYAEEQEDEEQERAKENKELRKIINGK